MFFYVVLAVLLFLYKKCIDKEFKILECIIRYFIYWLGLIYCGLWGWNIFLGKNIGKEAVIGLYVILPFIWLFYLVTQYGIVSAFKRNILKDEKAMPALGKVILLQIVCVFFYFCLFFVI